MSLQMSSAATRAPSRAIAVAISAPSPRAAPVTTATFPSSFNSRSFRDVVWLMLSGRSGRRVEHAADDVTRLDHGQGCVDVAEGQSPADHDGDVEPTDLGELHQSRHVPVDLRGPIVGPEDALALRTHQVGGQSELQAALRAAHESDRAARAGSLEGLTHGVHPAGDVERVLRPSAFCQLADLLDGVRAERVDGLG